jgi:hypothetical protein
MRHSKSSCEKKIVFYLFLAYNQYVKERMVKLTWQFEPLVRVLVEGYLRTRYGKVPVKGTLTPDSSRDTVSWAWSPDTSAPTATDTLSALVPEDIRAASQKSVLNGLQRAIMASDPFIELKQAVKAAYPKSLLITCPMKTKEAKRRYSNSDCFFTTVPMVSWTLDYRGQQLRPAIYLSLMSLARAELGELYRENFRDTRSVPLSEKWIEKMLDHIRKGCEIVDSLHEAFPEKEGYAVSTEAILARGTVTIHKGDKAAAHFNIDHSWAESGCFTSNIPQTLPDMITSVNYPSPEGDGLAAQGQVSLATIGWLAAALKESVGKRNARSQVPKEKYFNQKKGGNSSHPLKGMGLLAA